MKTFGNISLFYAAVVLLCCGITTSCKRDMFDIDAYNALIQETSPIGDIDARHNWTLTRPLTVSVHVDAAEASSPKSVCILSDNPYQQENVEILAEKKAAQGDVKTLFFYAPTYKSEFYAAILTSGGDYYLKKFDASQTDVSFTTGIILPGEELHVPDYQGYTYCFEEEYPKPSDDWDFNDLVLRVQKVPAQAENELRLSVTLAAVGCLKQMAAAIRLIGYGYDDVENVYIEEGRTFDGTFDDNGVKRQFIEDGSLLLRARNGEAVLNLFEDAHWSMSPRLQGGGQGVARLYYNTQRQVDGTTGAQIRPKTLTYVVKLRNPKNLENYTLNDLDVFAIEDFNSGKWEIHTFAHKAAAVLRDYGSNETATSNNMVWGLMVPNANFRYPIEGVNMGFYKDGILTGAYMKDDHSFGQWVMNCESAIDWFCYPSTGLVY